MGQNSHQPETRRGRIQRWSFEASQDLPFIQLLQDLDRSDRSWQNVVSLLCAVSQFFERDPL